MTIIYYLLKMVMFILYYLYSNTKGPYIHHCVGIHKNVVPVLYEACKYIGVKPDLYDPIEEDVKAYLRGE